MKLDQLRALDAVVRAGSFAKAANEILLITQPAVTRAIKNLETTIGFQLFTRDTYRPELTVRGAVFYQRALQILNEVDELTQLSALIAAGMEPELRVAIDSYVLLPKMLQAFHAINRACPSTQLQISFEPLGAPLRKLLDQTVDLALLVWVPEYQRHHQLETRPFARIQVFTVVAPDFPLLKAPGPVSRKALAPYIQVVERTEPLHAPVAPLSEVPECQRWYVSNVHAKKQVLLSGRSFGMMPSHVIENELKQGLLVPFENLEGFEIYEREIRIARYQNREMGPVLTRLWERLGA
ncbi:MAG: hypothetical protein CVV27_01875 [Candidatus Melainabacteria bacterium HGW-Melainabacteria-1]|nr:MAG: hypothetical protein CVV27_01875 [Candidatus Melainabacteria bacterium HGW-Melainabacteria-1]